MDTPEGYVPQNVPEQPRHVVKTCPRMVMKHAAKLKEKGKGFFVNKWSERSEELKAGTSINPIGFGINNEKPEGRFCVDGSHRAMGMSLNDGDAKELAIARYGKVEHPTLQDWVEAAIEYNQKHGTRWAECLIFKEDISGCFNQFCWHPNSAVLIGIEVAPDTIMFNTNGGFGMTGGGMVWDCIAREGDHRLQKILRCAWKRYVDDTMLYGRWEDCNHDKKSLFRFWEDFLGKGAISVKKSLTPAQTCVILGWVTNLERGVIHMNERSAGKIFFVFFAVDPEVAQPSGIWPLLAALAS